jgi:A nuclease family of the HNH/ENDO VII superfamily with conserved AHH
MNFEVRRSYRLVNRGEAGLACDHEGVALGAVDLARLGLGGKGLGRCEVLSLGELGDVLKSAYGPQPDQAVQRIHRGLRRAADWIDTGDVGRAGIETVNLGLPNLTPAAMIKLAEIADLAKRGDAWRNEPRVPAGQAGGGQWTTDGGGAGGTAADASGCADTYSRRPVYGGSFVPVSTAATAVAGFDGTGDLAVPGLARLGRAGLVVFGAAALQDLRILAQQGQIKDAIARFGLDSSRPAEVMAASAYVWSTYHLPTPTNDIPYSGPQLDAASQAVMRLVLIHPDLFANLGKDTRSADLIRLAANAGLSDYLVAIRVRPRGVVDPALQTTSARARAAIAADLKTGRMQAHHLIAANQWAKIGDIASLAAQAGWRPDSPSNLIGLPADNATRQEIGGSLPIHNGPHPAYDTATQALILAERTGRPNNLTPLEARAIMDSVATTNRYAIITRMYGDYIKAAI